MWKKILLAAILLVSSIWGYSLVFSSSLVFGFEVEYMWELSSQVYLDDTKLSKTIVAYKANSDISEYTIHSSCNTDTKFIQKYKNIYFFQVDFSQNRQCSNNNIVLHNGEDIIVHTMSQLDFIPKNHKFSEFIDYSDAELRLYAWGLSIDMRKNNVYKNYDGSEIVKYYPYLNGQRKYLEAEYQKNIIDEILLARDKKYLIPVRGKTLSSWHSKIPNAPRNYRASYTDGIHHGWDIDGYLWEEVIALDDGIIVRVVSEFDRSDFDKIDYGSNLSEYQKTRNLDILRGKQVWLKTMKGEVVFYSHLNDIAAGIEEWVRVTRWEVLGTIGVTGVPGKEYKDYHLHFPIMENPYRIEEAGSYDFGDYMFWNWKLKDLPRAEVLKQQKDIFE